MELVTQAQFNPPFRKVFVEHPLTDDLKSDLNPIVHVKDFMSAFAETAKKIAGITKGRIFKFENDRVFFYAFNESGKCYQRGRGVQR